MKKNFLTKITKILAVTLVCGIAVSGMAGRAEAKKSKKAEYKKTKVGIPLSEHNANMSLDNDGNVHFYQYKESWDENENYFFDIKLFKYTKNNSDIEGVRTLKCDDDCIEGVVELNDNNTLVVSNLDLNKKKYSLRFSIYDGDGNIVSSKIDNIDRDKDGIDIADVVKKGNKIYYVYYVNHSPKTGYDAHIRCFNIKTGKVVHDKKLNGKFESVSFIEIPGNKVYLCDNSNRIISFSLDGKKKNVYKLPKIRRDIKLASNDIIDCRKICVRGNYIYYTNGKDGIYRCKLNSTNKCFSMFYDTKNDSFFKSKGKLMYDFAVKDKNTFYARFFVNEPVIYGENNDPTLLVQYSKKK